MSAPIDLAAIRSRLAGQSGRTYWRSLEELAETPAFLEYLHREFPASASEWTDPVGRRRFLKLMAASLALAGATGCVRQPPEPIVPYVRPPEEVLPGRPLFFATAMPHGGAGLPLLVESHMGRPTKVEGNPDHGASLGATDVFAQAAVLTLYDPDRAQAVTFRREVRPWALFQGSLQAALGGQRALDGSGFRILTERVASPTLAAQLDEVLALFPKARWHQYEPAAPNHGPTGLREALGGDADLQLRLDRADVILSLDADFLSSGAGHVRHAREFSARRRPESGGPMNRLYAVESAPTPTGSKADHRLALRPSLIEPFARAVAAALGAGGGTPADAALDAGIRERWIPALVKDLQAHAGASLVVAGDTQPTAVHALAHAMNAALGNVGRTVVYTAPVQPNRTDDMASLRELVEAMQAGIVDLLLVLGGNPAFTAPGDLRFDAAMARVPQRVHLTPYENETSQLCHWNVPEAHFLEAWGDVRTDDGTVSIVQPLIAPLYAGRSAYELLASVTGQPDVSGHDLVRAHWERAFEGDGPSAALAAQGRQDAEDFEAFWRRALHDGFIAGSAAPAHEPGEAPPAPQGAPPAAAAGDEAPGGDEAFEIVFRPDPTVYDGRFANNAWLQELPKPLTKLTWDNAVIMSPDTAARLRVGLGDVVEVSYRGRSVQGPVCPQPGMAEGTLLLHFGYGRRVVGRVGAGTGFDAYAIRTSDAPWSGRGATVRRTGGRYPLAVTQGHFQMENRHLVRAGTIAQYREHPEFVHEMGHAPPADLTLYPEFRYEGYKWGMAIDLTACTGCNACVIACQAENNIPVVGKEQVLISREMHWLRVDTYYEGDPADPRVYHQPVPCMHCEKAPCEVVCPVAATVHSAEGLNDMVYNRCVGTRYCSNNCPYKVRRFNFLQYADWTTPTLKLMRNPDVTVRSRGVMEKCTYCVQRINHARQDASLEDRPIRDGEIVTACQAVCPAEAIVFGDLNDPNSRVTRLQAQHRNYGLLEDLNTRPRTTYLAALRNPNPDLEPPEQS